MDNLHDNHDNFDTDDELIEEFKELVTICYMMMVSCINAYEFFNANELITSLKREQSFC